MILENTKESIAEAKRLLGIDPQTPVGFTRLPEVGFVPMIEINGKRYLPGDQVP